MILLINRLIALLWDNNVLKNATLIFQQNSLWNIVILRIISKQIIRLAFFLLRCHYEWRKYPLICQKKGISDHFLTSFVANPNWNGKEQNSGFHHYTNVLYLVIISTRCLFNLFSCDSLICHLIRIFILRLIFYCDLNITRFCGQTK